MRERESHEIHLRG